MGPDPLDVAKMAADHGVRVFTVGFGTIQGGTIGFGSWSAYVRLDEETLKEIAEITHGEYFYAGTAADLRKVYKTLNSKFSMEKEPVEVSALFCGGAAVLMVISALLSLVWFQRL